MKLTYSVLHLAEILVILKKTDCHEKNGPTNSDNAELLNLIKQDFKLQKSVFNMQINFNKAGPNHPLQELYSSILSETIKNLKTLELRTSPKSTEGNCGYYHRVKMHPTNSVGLQAPKFLSCSLASYHFMRNQEEFERTFVTGVDCLPLPPCNPFNNWYYIFVHHQNVSIQPETVLSPSMNLTLTVRNAILIYLPQMKVFYLVRGKWWTFSRPFSDILPIEINSLSDIRVTAKKQKQNYQLEPFYVLSPYPTRIQFVKEYKFSIQRKDKSTNPGVLMDYVIFDKVNATATFIRGPSNLLALKQYINGISVPLGAGDTRWLNLEFSTFFSMHYTIFLTSTPKPAGHTFMFLIKPFQIMTWLGVVLSFIITLLVGTILFTVNFKILNKYTFEQRSTKNRLILTSTNCQQSLLLIMKILFLPLLDQSHLSSTQIRMVKSIESMKLLLGCWILCSIVISNFYRSSFVAFLVQPSEIYPPRTFQELVTSNYDIWMTTSFSNDILQNLKYNIKGLTGVDVTEHRLKVPLSAPMEKNKDCFLYILNGDTVCITYDLYTNIFARAFLTDEYGQDKFLISKDKIMPTLAGIPLSPFSSIKPTADKVISNLQKGGLIDKWLEINAKCNSNAGRKTAITRVLNGTAKASRNSIKLVSVDVIVYPIFLLMIGLVVSLTCFLYEFMVKPTYVYLN